jgi:O-antigen/teichoic acid export membrane protein
MPTTTAQPARQSGVRAGAGATQIFLAEMLILPTGLITAAYLTRTLGPAQYGLFTLCATIVTWLGWLVASTLGQATLKLIGENRLQEPRRSPLVAALFRLHLGAAFGTWVLLMVGADLIARRFGEPALAGYLRLFALEIATFGMAAFHRDLLIGMGRFIERARAAAVRWVVRMVLILALVQSGLSVYGAILGSVIASAAELAIARYYVRPSPFVRGPLPARLFPVVAPLAAYAVTMQLLNKLDLFLLKALGGSAAEAGYYGAAQNLTMAVTLLTLAFSPTLLTHLAALRSSGRRDEARHTAALALRCAFLLAPLAAAAAGARDEVVVLLFGERFGPSAPLFAMLVCAELALVVMSLATALLVAADHQKRALVIALLMLPVAVALHLYLIPRYGPFGAACVTACVACGGGSLMFFAALVAWDLPVPIATILRATGLAAASYAAAGVSCDPVALVVVKLAVIAIAVALGFLALGEISGEERHELRALLSRLAPGSSSGGGH